MLMYDTRLNSILFVFYLFMKDYGTVLFNTTCILMYCYLIFFLHCECIYENVFFFLGRYIIKTRNIITK